MASAPISKRPHLHRLAGIELQAARRACLDLEDELFAAAIGKDDGRREFLLLRDERDARRQRRATAVARDGDTRTELYPGELGLRHEEADENILRRQDREQRRHGRCLIAGTAQRV